MTSTTKKLPLPVSREQSVSLGAQFQSLKDDNKQIKKVLYGLAVLCVLLFIGTVVVVAVKNGQGTTFQTIGSGKVYEETTIDGETRINKITVVHCVSGEDIVSMWLANEKGTDARLVITDDPNNVISVVPVTTGRASWNKDHIVMGGMIFVPGVPNEECTNDDRRRKLSEGNGIDNNDTPSLFDSSSIHRELKNRVNFLNGRRLERTAGVIGSIGQLKKHGVWHTTGNEIAGLKQLV